MANISFQKVYEVTQLSKCKISQLIVRPYAEINKFEEVGLTVSQADSIAIHLGYHPTEIWGYDEWIGYLENYV